ncbi:hypothetical protein E2C01_060240 [Portunus trituberculatus]|uniref:Uncharacterized protein n=1 Tax=Portunus trituberculatus TaxID=210409 RepID=A0A5B7H9X9_PORTR|nr:hypothetical protein [Portunus trituberculatus]
MGDGSGGGGGATAAAPVDGTDNIDASSEAREGEHSVTPSVAAAVSRAEGDERMRPQVGRSSPHNAQCRERVVVRRAPKPRPFTPPPFTPQTGNGLKTPSPLVPSPSLHLFAANLIT